MTPAERDEIQRLLRNALQPFREELDALKGVDKRFDEDLRKHSGAHKDLAKNVRESLDDVKTATLESVDAKLDSFRAEMRAERDELVKAPAAAEGAKSAAEGAQSAATSLAIRQATDATDQRTRFWITIIPVIAAAAASIIKLFI